MSDSSRIGLAIFFIAAISVVAYAYLPPYLWDQTPGGVPPDKYVAIYEEYNEDWEILEGNGTIVFRPETTPVPKPFDFDGSLGYTEQYADMPANFEIFSCVWYKYSSPAENYTSPNYGGLEVPIYPLYLVANFAIHSIDEDGTLNATHNNQPVILRAGEKWQSPVMSITKNESFVIDDGRGIHSKTYERFVVRYNYTWIIENKGVFNKSDLKV